MIGWMIFLAVYCIGAVLAVVWAINTHDKACNAGREEYERELMRIISGAANSCKGHESKKGVTEHGN